MPADLVSARKTAVIVSRGRVGFTLTLIPIFLGREALQARRGWPSSRVTAALAGSLLRTCHRQGSLLSH